MMAGIHFHYKDFEQLIRLNMGIANRLDENRAESLTVLYCDFEGIKSEIIQSSLEEVLRNSDSIVNKKKDYFFVLPYTDKYGANVVKQMFNDFFGLEIPSLMVSYPKDGEDIEELTAVLQNLAKSKLDKDLSYLD